MFNLLIIRLLLNFQKSYSKKTFIFPTFLFLNYGGLTGERIS